MQARHGPAPKPLLERLEDKFLIDDGCWEWQGYLVKGYGQMRFGADRKLAHRLVYELLVGPIPDGLTLDHLCRNRACVRPDHLEPVSMRENVLRSPIAVSAVNARKTHCLRGHPFDEANTYRHGGRRICRACSRTKALAAYHRSRECPLVK